MIRAFWILTFFFFASGLKAAEPTPTVFYPLPTQAQGKVFAAKQLFLADGGGIWFQDVRNQILFFDGQDIIPRSGSALEHDVDQVAFFDNAFWSFFQNEIYRTEPNKERELVFSLQPGTEIQRIGASKRFIWVSDKTSFYTYEVATGDFNTFSLLPLYQYSHTSNIQVNDAKFILSKWVVATNAGVYLSDGSRFEHIVSSGQNYVEKLYFSDKRRELVVGALNGALVFDIEQPSKAVKKIAGSHVLSITETNQEYWIGTEKGLIVYSFLTGEVQRLTSSGSNDRAVQDGKIYALLNDHAGGIWVATDGGVRYFSQFSHNFERYPDSIASNSIGRAPPSFITKTENDDGYWMLSEVGLYRVSLTKSKAKQLVFRGKVHDLVEVDGVVWLATDDGIKCLDSLTGQVMESPEFPLYLKSSPIRHLELSGDNQLWGESGQQLWSYNLTTGQLTQYGAKWMIRKYLPAQLTEMKLTSHGYLVLGTEHGVYVMRDGQVNFIGESVPYGLVTNIIQVSSQALWVAGRYGLYQFDLSSGHVESIALLDGHITPKCLIVNRDGVWLTSSAGLSRYMGDGRLVRHYGEPFGLFSNEFAPDLCSYGADSEHTLILGTYTGLIKVSTQQLVVSRLPEVKVIIGQVKVNQTLRSLGETSKSRLQLGYGESISFQFGVLPQVSTAHLEYRLNQEEWQLLDGSTLNIDHLMPGHYQLDVRAVLNVNQHGQSKQFEFYVAKPWFLTHYALFGYFTLTSMLLAGFVYWRSRMMTKANRQLKGQVALKTNQLRHQSRILLSNNHQLRKQLQIRRLIMDQSIELMKERVNDHLMGPLSATANQDKELLDYLMQELDLLLHIRTTNGEAKPVYNLNLILHSVLNGWEEELVKLGVQVDLTSNGESDRYVCLSNFNLDELLNTVMDSITKRCYRNQSVLMAVRKEGQWVTLSIIDQGDALESDNQSSLLQSIRSLVAQSGGKMTTHSSPDRNLLELIWQGGESFTEESVIQASSLEEPLDMPNEDPWMMKVRSLVKERFSDPEFSTSVAAKLLFVSERSLQRRLKSSIEKTFTEYLTEVRLDNACRRLLAGEKVSDVAFECGFNDPSYFSQRFKHRFGVPPTQFVEQKEQ